MTIFKSQMMTWTYRECQLDSQIDRQKSLSLKILDGYVTDLGKGIVRLDDESMNLLQLVNGDMVRIEAIRPIVLQCLSRNPTDKSVGNAQNIIRINKEERYKIGVSVGDTVIVQKAS